MATNGSQAVFNNLENLKIRQLYILKFDSALSRTALSFDSASV